MTEVEKLEDLIDRLLWSNEDPLSCQEVLSVYKAAYKLGRVSVYNENGWNEEDALVKVLMVEPTPPSNRKN